jgi:hypothetical protein
MRPDVALAFDRMARAARADGVALVINSAFRSDAEQAELWRRHPDPRWVAPPGTSLHRNGTELDLGPPAAYGWLAANAGRFHFTQRYSWEPWHQETLLALNEQTTATRVAVSIAIIGMREHARGLEGLSLIVHGGRPGRRRVRFRSPREVRYSLRRVQRARAPARPRTSGGDALAVAAEAKPAVPVGLQRQRHRAAFIRDEASLVEQVDDLGCGLQEQSSLQPLARE